VIAGVLKGKGIPLPGLGLAFAILLEIGAAVVIVLGRFLPPSHRRPLKIKAVQAIKPPILTAATVQPYSLLKLAQWAQ